MPQLFHFVAEQFKESLMLGGQSQHMVAGRLCQYLKPWQLEGLRFLYKNHEKGESCILNDESGLGKVVTVSTFLGSILTNDTTKKCLIIVRDEAAIEEWRFHLSVLTHLTVKVIDKTTDINFETVFLIKWSTLKNICEIDKVNFDHIIVDNRGEMLNNKFCTGILLRYFENKTTLIISSADVTSDIKLLHILLRLCGRLERQFVDVKVFEDKFQLPQLQEGVSNKVDLEDYFLKRERVINFCREFRLRRYCHQFDEEFPIVSRSEFQRHLEQWQNQNKNSISSGSVKLMSSSSEKDTEELFKEYFQVKEECDIHRLDDEVQQINEQPNIMDFENIGHSSDDVVVMSPLVFVSESESEDDDDQIQIQNDRNSQFIEEIEDEEDVIRDKAKKTSKDSENNTSKNRRKAKTPVKTPTKSSSNNINSHLDDSKSLRSRTLSSPKKPLPIRTNSRKSLESDKVKGDSTIKQKKDSESENRLKNQDNTKKIRQRDEKKTKAIKDIDKKKVNEDSSKPKGSCSNKDDDKEKEKDKRKSPGGESVSSKDIQKKQNISNDKKPENSSKPKHGEAGKKDKLEKSKSLQEKSELIKTALVKLKTIPDNTNDEREKMMTILKEDRKITEESKKQTESVKEIQINTNQKINSPAKNKSRNKVEEKENEKDKDKTHTIVCRKSATINLMLEEALKFVENEKIGRREKKSANTKRRAKTLEVPKLIARTKDKPENPSKNILISKRPQTQPQTKKHIAKTIKNKLETPKKSPKPLTELAPIGVHSLTTRGMQRHTRSNQGTTSKYMKVAIAQVGIDKKNSPRGIPRRRKSVVLVRKLVPKAKKDEKPPSPSPTPSVISASPDESIQLGQALSPTNNFVVPDFIAPAPRNFNYHFPLMLDKETSDSECQITSQNSNNHEVIVLTGSSTNDREMEPPKSTVSRRKATGTKPPMVTIHRPIFSKAKSPDLFSTCSDVSLPCSQQQTNKSHFEGFKIFGSELRQPYKSRSCLDILERMLEPRTGKIAEKQTNPTTQEKPKTSSHQHCVENEDAMFEITSNGTFGNTVRINSNGEMSPIRNKNQSTPPASGHPKNRITNYLISNSQHSSIINQPSPSSLEDMNDLLPKTPKRRKSLSGSAKRSPRLLSVCSTSGKSQSTKLTQWLVKNSNSQKNTDSHGKPPPTKRRRLDLSFADK